MPLTEETLIIRPYPDFARIIERERPDGLLPTLGGQTGLNLAVVYGMGLIIFALILALIYNHLCTQKERELASASAQQAVATEEGEKSE